MKRILIFSLAYHPVVGGAEVAIKEITDRISDTTFDMVTLRFDKSHPAVEKVGNINIYRINSSKNLFPFKAYRFAKKLQKQNSYDVVWAIMANWAGFAALFFKQKFPKVKFVLTLQEGDPLEYIKRKVWFVYPIFKNIFKKADKVQAISTFLGDWAKDMGYGGEVEVIPNGVDKELFSKIPDPARIQILHERFEKKDGDVFLITTSRLVNKNGVSDIIASLTFLPENYKLLILGVGPLDASLESEAKKLRVENRVMFLGYVKYEDIPPYLNISDIFVRPSLSEGMGNSFIEAMAAGLPVIATPVGGIVDFLHDPSSSSGQVATGLFCEVNNPKSIAEQVKKLLDNPELKNKIVENAKRMVEEKYDWGLIAREMESRVLKA